MKTRFAAILAVLVAFAAVVLYGITQANTTASADAPKTETGPVKKVTICHFTSIHADHPYNEITISAGQIVNGDGHGAHVYDIWPSFQYKLKDGTIVTVPCTATRRSCATTAGSRVRPRRSLRALRSPPR